METYKNYRIETLRVGKYNWNWGFMVWKGDMLLQEDLVGFSTEWEAIFSAKMVIDLLIEEGGE